MRMPRLRPRRSLIVILWAPLSTTLLAATARADLLTGPLATFSKPLAVGDMSVSFDVTPPAFNPFAGTVTKATLTVHLGVVNAAATATNLSSNPLTSGGDIFVYTATGPLNYSSVDNGPSVFVLSGVQFGPNQTRTLAPDSNGLPRGVTDVSSVSISPGAPPPTLAGTVSILANYRLENRSEPLQLNVLSGAFQGSAQETIEFTPAASAVPEPGTLAPAALGAVAALAYRRCRRRRAAA